MTRRNTVIPADIEALLLSGLSDDGVPMPSPGLKSRVLARVDEDVRSQAAIVTLRAGEGAWQKIGSGVEVRTLRDDGLTRTWLARMSPGSQRSSSASTGTLTSRPRWSARQSKRPQPIWAPPGAMICTALGW